MTRTLSRQQVRTALLHVQGIGRPPKPNRAGVMQAIRRMQELQIDTISVVARSQYLVLWSRLGDYDPALLDALHADGQLFEYWSHAACYLPVEDYPLFRRLMLDSLIPWYHHPVRAAWRAENAAALQGMLDHVRESGPVRSADFERPEGEKGGGWWSRKIEKHLLENLFTSGDLMIAKRQNFQRIYDLRERVLPLPLHDDATVPDAETALRALTLKVVNALGVARADWVKWYLSYLFTPLTTITRRLRDLVESGDLEEVRMEGSKLPAFVPVDAKFPARRTAVEGVTTFLSPFDPIC
ncbi:hypothetical protein AYO38_11970, partial [bacterium SCGC AG-212-C10]